MVGQEAPSLLRRRWIPECPEQGEQIFERILSVELAALHQGVHEGGASGGFFAPDILTTLKIKLDRLHALFAKVVWKLEVAVDPMILHMLASVFFD